MKTIRFTLTDGALMYSDILNNQNSLTIYRAAIERGKNIFGSDLSMLGTGILNVKNSELSTVTGLLNFAQKLQHFLMTDAGTLPEDENWGIAWSNYIGKPYGNKQTLFGAISTELNSKLSVFPGVKSVDRITIEFIDVFSLNVNLEITPITFDTPIKLEGIIRA